MFRSKYFFYNNKYSRDYGVALAHFDSEILHDIGVEYTTTVELTNDLTDYNPFYMESFATPSEIELNLLFFNPLTSQALEEGAYNLEEIYDWLIGDGSFMPFIPDDNTQLTYYLKPIRISKVQTFDGRGYLRVNFLPYSNYAYKTSNYNMNVNGVEEIDVYNPSLKNYFPIIQITNLGDTSTINKVNDMEITNLETNETITIDNLTKVVVDEEGNNRFLDINRQWIEMKSKEVTTFKIEGNCKIKIICEFPILA